MEQQERPDKTPTLVGQALHWLDKMKIPYTYCKEADMWQFKYDNAFISIPNGIDDREIGFITIVCYEDELKDEEIQKMVFDFAVMLVKDEPDFKNAEISYMSEEFGNISTWYGISNPKYKPRLFKKKLIEFLDEISKLQLKFCLMCDVAYEALFNPPAEVIHEALGDTNEFVNEDNMESNG